MTTLFSYAKNRRTAALLSTFVGFAFAATLPVAAAASPAVVQDSGTGDVCDVCSLSFDPVACDAAGREPYDSVEQFPDGSLRYPEASAPQPAPTPKPAPSPTPTPKPVVTSTPKPAPATTAAPKPATTQAPAAAPKADQPASSSNNNAAATQTETTSNRGTEVASSRNNPAQGSEPQSQVASEQQLPVAEDLSTDEATAELNGEISAEEATEEAAADIAEAAAEQAAQDNQGEPGANGEVVAANAPSGTSTSGAGLALLGGLVAASGAGLGVHYLRKSRAAATN